jgi:hypothetical protein
LIFYYLHNVVCRCASACTWGMRPQTARRRVRRACWRWGSLGGPTRGPSGRGSLTSWWMTPPASGARWGCHRCCSLSNHVVSDPHVCIGEQLNPPSSEPSRSQVRSKPSQVKAESAPSQARAKSEPSQVREKSSASAPSQGQVRSEPSQRQFSVKSVSSQSEVRAKSVPVQHQVSTKSGQPQVRARSAPSWVNSKSGQRQVRSEPSQSRFRSVPSQVRARSVPSQRQISTMSAPSQVIAKSGQSQVSANSSQRHKMHCHHRWVVYVLQCRALLHGERQVSLGGAYYTVFPKFNFIVILVRAAR